MKCGLATLAAAGIPIFFLDLRPALEAGGTVADWLSTAHPWRMAGAVYDPGAADAFYRTQAPGEAFEGLIYIQDTTRARPSGVAAFADLNPGDRPRLGVQVRQADDDEPGVIIQSIIAHTPAEEAGLNSGDRLLEIDGRVIRSANDIQTALGGHEAGTVVHALVLRESRRMEIPIRLSSPSTRPAR